MDHKNSFPRRLKVLGVIPARFGSTRLPGKPLLKISGRPLIEWVYRAAKKALRDVVVATDDKRIFKAVNNFKGHVVMTPRNIKSGTDRMAWVARRIKADFYVNIQGDEPLIQRDTIKNVVKLARKMNGIGTVATVLKGIGKNNPHQVKVVIGKKNRALYFSRSEIPFSQQKSGKQNFFKHMGVYVYPRKILLQFVNLPPSPLEMREKLEQLRAVYNGIPIYVNIGSRDSQGVDTKEDFKLVKKLLERKT